MRNFYTDALPFIGLMSVILILLVQMAENDRVYRKFLQEAVARGLMERVYDDKGKEVIRWVEMKQPIEEPDNAIW